VYLKIKIITINTTFTVIMIKTIIRLWSWCSYPEPLNCMFRKHR